MKFFELPQDLMAMCDLAEMPERVLRLLATVHADRAKAIVRLADLILAADGGLPPPVTTVAIGEGRAIILTSYSERLERLPWLRLVEVAPGRHLLSIRSGTPVETVELTLHDQLEDLPAEAAVDREIMSALLRIVRMSRRMNTALKEEILFPKFGRFRGFRPAGPSPDHSASGTRKVLRTGKCCKSRAVSSHSAGGGRGFHRRESKTRPSGNFWSASTVGAWYGARAGLGRT